LPVRSRSVEYIKRRFILKFGLVYLQGPGISQGLSDHLRYLVIHSVYRVRVKVAGQAEP